MAQDTVEIPQDIRNYLESVIAEANVPIFDDKSKEDLVQYLFEKLDRFLATKIVEHMKPEDVGQFIELNKDKKSKEEIDKYLEEHMENPEEVFTRAFIDFRDVYLSGQQAPSNASN